MPFKMRVKPTRFGIRARGAHTPKRKPKAAGKRKALPKFPRKR